MLIKEVLRPCMKNLMCLLGSVGTGSDKEKFQWCDCVLFNHHKILFLGLMVLPKIKLRLCPENNYNINKNSIPVGLPTKWNGFSTKKIS